MASRSAGDPRIAIIVAAAGSGQRFGADIPKTFVRFGEQTLLEHCLTRLLTLSRDVQVVTAVPADEMARARQIRDSFPSLEIDLVAGGSERVETVRRALDNVSPDSDVVLVHDAARAFTPTDVFDRVLNAVLAGAPSVVPVLPVTDTVRSLTGGDTLGEPIDRNTLRLIQTPQGFAAPLLRAAYDEFGEAVATDDAAIMEMAGYATVAVPGDRLAFKVTDPFDAQVAQAILTPPSSYL